MFENLNGLIYRGCAGRQPVQAILYGPMNRLLHNIQTRCLGVNSLLLDLQSSREMLINHAIVSEILVNVSSGKGF